MNNRQIYPICAAILILACCTPKVEPIQFEVPEVEYTVQQDNLSVSVGEPMTFGAKVLKGEGLSLGWYVDGVLESSAKDFTYTWKTPGDHEVRFEASNGAGSQSKTYTVSVTDVLEIFLSSEKDYQIGTSTECLEQDFIRVCAVVVKGSNVSHEWSVDGVKQECTAALFDTYMTPTGKGTHTVSYKGSNSVGSFTKEFTVNVVERPLTITFSEEAATIVVPRGGSQTLTATIKYGGSGAGYNWYLDDAPVSDQPTYTFNATTAGEYVIRFSSQNAKGEKVERSWHIVVPSRTEVLLEDYEDGKGKGLFVKQSGGVLTVVDNPKPDAVNGSAKCLKVTGSGSGYFGCMKSTVKSVFGIDWTEYSGMKMDLYIENSKNVKFCPALDKKTGGVAGYVWAETYAYEQWITVDYDLKLETYTGTQIQPRPFVLRGSTSGKGNNTDAVYYDNVYFYK